MSTIAVDVDSTLYDFEGPAREAAFKLWQQTGDDIYKVGAYASWGSEWRAPADIMGLDRWLKCIELVHDSDVILSRIPFDGAVEVCQALMRAGHSLIYISNRATEAADATREWLESCGFFDTRDYIGEGNGPNLDGEAEVICLMGDKAPHMRECRYLIDDRLKTCVEFVYDMEWRTYEVDDPRKAFVKAYPYNQAGTDIPGLLVAPTWAGINHFMIKEGLLEEAAFEALV